MKKLLSLIISSAICVSSLCMTANTSAASEGGLVILGDSISSDYGLDPASEYNYGQICADYLGWDAVNHAVSGDDTAELIELIANDSEVRDSISGADAVVISIGGNDIIQYISREVMEYAASKGYLNEGFTADDIPEKPSVTDLYTMVKLTDENGTYEGDCLLSYMKNNQMAALTLINTISSNLCTSSDVYEGFIPNTVIPNIESIRDSILTLNSDAQIIFQTVYQPIQFTYEYYNERFGASGSYASIDTAFTVLRTNLNNIMGTMRSSMLELENVSIADVYYEFTSLENIADSIKNKTQGSAHYFTDIQSAGADRDFHPNQKGHLAIAAAVLEQIGELHNTDNSFLIRQIYEGLADKAEYPEIALETYNLVAGSYTLGDINTDKSIDARDATLILQQYAAASLTDTNILDDIQMLAANVNKDDTVDARDASIVLSYYAYTSLNGTGSLEDFIANNQ